LREGENKPRPPIAAEILLIRKEEPMQERYVRYLLALVVVSLGALPVEATDPGPPTVTSLFVPIEGDVLEPGTSNVVHLTGEIHILTRAVFDPTANEWEVALYGNLVRVRGTSAATGITYLGVGAANWVGIKPGPPNNEVPLTFELVGIKPGPPDFPPSPILPVFLRDFVFAQEAGHEGQLDSVTATFD
jgi:hypothetical protein